MSDSLGSFSMIGSIAHPSPNGTSRVSDMARRSVRWPEHACMVDHGLRIIRVQSLLRLLSVKRP
jgi:hypothetical protein